MPGHKGTNLFKRLGYDKFMKDFFDYDITEFPGADSLHQAEGIIKQSQDEYAQLYGVKHSYYLVNSSTGGVIASILATVKKGKKLLLARNCHKSAFNALSLADIQPVYVHPEYLEEWGISGAIKPDDIEKALSSNTDIEAVILPSPNYYGVCSDIKAIADIVHKYGKILIVDQAHGAHLKFFSNWDTRKDMPKSAEEQGADIVINSIHKTLGSLTQTAVLNLNSDNVDQFRLEDKLRAIQSTSPSYILMTSLELNKEILNQHGKQLLTEWSDNLDYFYEGAKKIPGLRIMNNIDRMDWTKINLDMSAYDIDGAELEKLLIDDQIYPELYTGNILMCMTGLGNTRSDYEKLLNRLTVIADANTLVPDDVPKKKKLVLPAPPRVTDIPRGKKRVKLEDSIGCVCALSVIPYPPGIPLVCPGEIIEQDAVDYLIELRKEGEKVIGVDGNGDILVGE